MLTRLKIINLNSQSYETTQMVQDYCNPPGIPKAPAHIQSSMTYVGIVQCLVPNTVNTRNAHLYHSDLKPSPSTSVNLVTEQSTSINAVSCLALAVTSNLATPAD